MGIGQAERSGSRLTTGSGLAAVHVLPVGRGERWRGLEMVGVTCETGTDNSASDVRRASFCEETEAPLAIGGTGAGLTLENIIPATRTRRLFERFLSLHPTSYHLSDVRRLDTFTCAVHRWCRGRLDCDGLQRHLIEVLHWTAEDAAWCRGGIVTGLDLLEANRDF